MPITILGGTKLADTTFSVANSCRWNDGDSPYMYKSQSDGDEDHYTISMWIKRCELGVAYNPLWQCPVDGSNCTYATFYGDDTLEWVSYTGNATKGTKRTNRKFRDIGAWYHLVFRYDSDNGTAGDRMRLYVNGVEETSWGTDTSPSSGQDHWVNSNSAPFNLGYDNAQVLGGSATYFDGYMAEVCLIDGSSLAPTSFGEFDEDSPTIWKPIDVSGLTFGTNGFYLDFEDSSNLGNDANGGTDLTESGIAAADQSVDSPTNNFCTFNSLIVPTSNPSTFSQGNTKITNSASGWRPGFGTFPVSSGKWYFEVKGLLFPGTSYMQIGWVSLDYAQAGNSAASDEISGWGNTDPAVAYDSRAGNIYYQFITSNSNDTSYGDSYTAGDIIGCALDLDNSKIYFAEDNTWKNSGDPTSGATGTGAHSILSGYTWVPFIGINNATAEVTFASPATANSSGNADENGYGDFEFAPPSGYLAICSKNTV